jgi:hypothetical protein
LDQEFLKFSDLVSLLFCLSQVEPRSLAFSSFVVVLLDDLLDLGDPGFLEVVTLLGDGRGLDLIELIDTQCLGDIGVVDVAVGCLVALFVDFLLGSYDLLFDLEGLEAVLRESLGKAVSRLGDADHTEVGGLLFGLGCGQVELSSDQVCAFFVEMLVEDDVVHRLGEVTIDLIE